MTATDKALMEAAEVIGYARDFVDGQIDVEDGDYGVPRPNKAMQLAQRLDEAMDLIDAAMNAPANIGDEWRPIETASLDPTAKPILAWIPFRHGGGCVNIIEWDFDDSAWREWQGHLLGAYKPSHWQPLPSPPAQTGGDRT